MIFRNYFINPPRRRLRILADGPQISSPLIQRQLRNKLSYLRNRLFIILHPIMSHSRKLIMRPRAAECFVINRLTRRALHQICSAQAHERSAFDHDHDVRKRRQICTSCDTRPHHRRNLRDPQIAPHDRVIIENARGSILAREDTTLIRKVYSGGIDEVNNRHARPHSDLLRAQNLFDCLRPP